MSVPGPEDKIRRVILKRVDGDSSWGWRGLTPFFGIYTF